MGRPIRQFVAGYPVHVMQRGNDRQDVFRCESDFRFMWTSLKKASEDFAVAVNAYVFMTNHVHLMLTPRDESSISKMMQWTQRRYCRYFNTRYERTGTLWEGRFRASVITRDEYLLNCHRYIDMNPVRARIVSAPRDYAWSSHRFYADAEPNPLVNAHDGLSCLGDDEESRRQGYANLFALPLGRGALEEIRACAKSGRPIGQPARRGRPRRGNGV
jgi:putative transposase